MSPVEQRVLAAVRGHLVRYGVSPTLAEIGATIGYRSRGSVRRYVNRLVARGDLARGPRGTARNLRLAASPTDTPVLGRIAAGQPIEAIEHPEDDKYQDRPPPGCYKLEVAGDSMIDAGILDGDVVVIRPAQRARNGQIVVALIDGGDATLKRFYVRNGRVILVAENPAYPAQTYDPERVEIQGILFEVRRRYR